jgi:glycosyltransferase involved in cell wall biosynthesis
MLVKYGVCRREKIFIAPNGHEHALLWDATRAEIPLIKTLKRPYVLLLGSRAKHKNIDVILEQAQGLDEAGIDIVVVGAASSIFASNASTFQRSNIHYAGYVGDDDLAALYGGALCLVFPSKTEGFGIPLLEAMARGCPSSPQMQKVSWRWAGMPLPMSILITARAGGTRSSACQAMTAFARQCPCKGERERCCSPGSAAGNCT